MKYYSINSINRKYCDIRILIKEEIRQSIKVVVNKNKKTFTKKFNSVKKSLIEAKKVKNRPRLKKKSVKKLLKKRNQ